MKKNLLIFFSFFCLTIVYSQDMIDFNGKIMNDKGFIYNVNVINRKIYKGTVSDFHGNFSLSVSKNDTITFSCIGYKRYTYTIPDTLTNNNHRVIVTLVEDTVMLREAIITPWPINRTLLKEAFLDEKDTEKEQISSFAGFREIEGDPQEPDPTILNPISFIANIFSKKRIQQKKMDKIRRKLYEN